MITRKNDEAKVRSIQWDHSDYLIAVNDEWVLTDADAINDKGEIVGSGYHKGKIRSFLLNPIQH